MKKLTLNLYERIIDAVHEKSRNHLNMLGHVTRDECAEYIGFYAHHGGLFWSEQDGKIRGVATAHPGKRNFDWTWQKPNGEWTAHLVWADNTKAHADTLGQFLQQQTSSVQLWTWRKHQAVELNQKKLERIFSYGRRRNNNSTSASASVQRVDALNTAGSGGSCSAGIPERAAVSASVQPTADSATGDSDSGCDAASQGAVSTGCSS